VTDVQGCIACDLSAGRRDLPGGRVHQTDYWRVEHCVGPLGVGTLVVKPIRHVEHLADLESGEALELGPLLAKTCRVVGKLAARVVGKLTEASQVYVCLWSHGPAHVHFVIQPEVETVIDDVGRWGPAAQAAMFERSDLPDPGEVGVFCDHARREFQAT
jgi:diadenosine tetraphosphate (Ap4A) HIT family hydrolase